MIKVWIPSELAYFDVQCSESPWGSVSMFNEEIFQWLEDRCAVPDWDHDEAPGGGCHIMIKDPKVAVLFKLTWGGR